MKTHLIRPDDKQKKLTMCGIVLGLLANINVKSTDDPKEVDCKTCESIYLLNKDWYYKLLMKD